MELGEAPDGVFHGREDAIVAHELGDDELDIVGLQLVVELLEGLATAEADVGDACRVKAEPSGLVPGQYERRSWSMIDATIAITMPCSTPR